LATLRDIRRRIATIQSTEQITKAMKMVAAAKLRKAQNRILQARPYAKRLDEVIGHVTARVDRSLHPLLYERPAEKVCYVVITADRGLCGSFNGNIIRRAKDELDASTAEEKSLILIGRKGRDHFIKQKWPVIGDYTDFFEELEFNYATIIGSDLIKQFIDKKIDHIYLIYNEFKSAVNQQIIVDQLLPIIPIYSEEKRHSAEYIYEPSPEVVLNEMCPKNINVQIWRVLLESYAAEQGARMVAMEAATDNANEMTRNLTLHYNKVRQATITKELIEIVGGAEALRAR